MKAQKLNKDFEEIVNKLRQMGLVRYNKEIAELLGLKTSNMSHLLAGRRTATKQMIEKLYIAYPQLNDNSVVKNVVSESLPVYSKTKQVPVYDIEATAGEFEWNGDLPEKVIGHINLPSFSECVAFIYVRGVSMANKLMPGDLIGIIPVLDLSIIQYGNIYLSITTDNQRLLKYIRKSDNEDFVILRSENPDFDDMKVSISKIRKLFRVKGPIRDDWQ